MTPAADDASEVKKLDNQWAEDAIKGDTVALSRLLTDDLRYVHSNGAIDTKQTLVSAIASGALVYKSIDSEDVEVRIIGSAAVLTSTTRLRIKSRGDEHDFQALVTGGCTRPVGRHDRRGAAGSLRFDPDGTRSFERFDDLAAEAVVLGAGPGVMRHDQHRKLGVSLGDAAELSELLGRLGAELAALAHGAQRDHHTPVVPERQEVGAAQLAEQGVGLAA